MNVKAGKQLIALNLVLVLLLSLFPGVAFAADSASESAALSPGDSFTVTKSAEEAFPAFSVQAPESGFYYIHVAPPRWSLATTGETYTSACHMILYASDPADSFSAGGMYDAVYYLSNGEHSFSLQKNEEWISLAGDFDDSGEWTISFDRIRTDSLNVDEPVHVSDANMRVFFVEIPESGSYCMRIAGGSVTTLIPMETGYSESRDQLDIFMADEGDTYAFIVTPTWDDSADFSVVSAPTRGTLGAEGDNLSWEYDVKTQTLEITGTGSMGVLNGYAPWHALRSDIRALRLSDGITDIADQAFFQCSNLREAQLPDSIERIGRSAFSLCEALQMPAFPSGLKEIGDDAFWSCRIGDTLTLPSSLQTIGNGAFSYSSVQTVSIPASVTSIGESAFRTYRLREITVDDANPSYQVVDGVLLTKDGTTLLTYPGSRSGPYTIPDGVTRVAADAFFYCRSLYSLGVPASVQSVGSITPGNLYAVHYAGTAEQWAEINGNSAFEMVNGGQVVYEADLSHSIGGMMQYNDAQDGHQTLRFTPDETGVYFTSFYNQTTNQDSSYYTSFGMMQLYVTDADGDVPNLTAGSGSGQRTVLLKADVPYEIHTSGRTYDCEWSLFAQKLAAPALSLGENRVLSSEYNEHPWFYLFTAPEFGWYSLSAAEEETGSEKTVLHFSADAWRSDSNTMLLSEGETAVLCVPGSEANTVLTIQKSVLEGDCGDHAKWKLEADGTLVIRGTGAMWDYSSIWDEEPNLAPWDDLRGGIRSIRVEDGITEIGAYAFASCQAATELSLPGSLRKIGQNAFQTCSALTELVIPNGVTEIGACAFIENYQLASISIPGSLKRIGSAAFSSCGITELTIPDGVEEIGQEAFFGNRSLERVVLADSVKTIGLYAFNNCESLRSIRLPAGLESVGYGVVAMTALEEIILPAQNQNFVLENGVLYDRQKTTVYFAEQDLSSSYTIPNSVTELTDWAFCGCDTLTEVTIPNGVERVPYGCFANCSGLRTVHIPTSVRSVDDEAFLNCSLQDVYFDGSMLRWNSVYTGDPLAPNMHYTEDFTSKEIKLGANSMAVADEAEAFRFVAPESGVYRLTASRYTGDYLRVVDSLGNHIVKQTVYGDEPWTFALDAGEEAFIIVYNYSAPETMEFTLTLSAEKSIQVTADETYDIDENREYFYRFTPAESANYNFSVSSDEWCEMALCDSHLNILDDFNGYYFRIRRELDAGKTYYIRFGFSDQNPDRSSAWSITVAPPVTPIIVTMGENSVFVDGEVLCPFTPETSGTYRMEGTTYGSDTYLTLYDENHNWLASNDDSAGNAQFLLEYSMEAGKTYYLGVRFYSNGTGTITFNVSANGAAIVRQPQNVVCPKGDNAVFSVEATGTDLTYQWQYRTSETGKWYNSSSATQGYNTPALTVAAEQRRDGYQYRCVVTDGFGNAATSEPATLTIMTAPEITAQPQNLTASVGETAEFAVEAAGAELTYQWQYQSAGSTTWSNSGMTGAKTDRLQVPATAARNGQKYRCVITNAAGSVTSEPASLTVLSKPEITTQPQSVTAAAGDTVQFTVQAKGSNLTYQWQYKTAGSSAWSNSTMTGAKTASMTVPVTTGRNGYQYRCVITNAAGSVTSEPATLTALAKPAITTQPQSVTANAGDTVKFTVKATGTDLKYQWQYQTAGSSAWSNSTMTGAKTATMTVPVTTGRNGYHYRCVVTNAAGSVTSNAAKLTVLSALRITAQPKSTVAAPGTKAVFTVKAEGSGLKYQWQYRTSATGTWNNSSSATQGYNTAKLTVVAEQRRSGYQYRCIVTDSTGKKVTSSAATLQVQTLAITKQPVNASGKVGETVSFTVQAKGGGLMYQWQFAPAGSNTWKNSGMTGAKTTTLQVPVTAARNGQQYRCVVTDGAGNTLTTQTAVLRVTG